MSYKFEADYATEIFINANNGITIKQEQEGGDVCVICFGSRRRAEQVAEAILHVSKLASFDPCQQEEDGE